MRTAIALAAIVVAGCSASSKAAAPTPLQREITGLFHFYPLRVRDFADGVHVVAGGKHVGKRVAAIDGVPIGEVIERVEPLIPRDNASTVRLLLPEYLVCAEVLRGLGIVDGPATYRFGDGSESTVEPGIGGLGAAFAPLP